MASILKRSSSGDEHADRVGGDEGDIREVDDRGTVASGHDAREAQFDRLRSLDPQVAAERDVRLGVVEADLDQFGVERRLGHLTA